jgi:hemerythrin
VPIEWDSALSLGVEQLDVEHRQLMRRGRQLAQAVRDGRPEEIRGELRFLHAYLGEHFAHEEEWMAEQGYPGAADHARRHAALLEALSGVRQRAIDQPGAVARVAAELAEVLDEHMRIEDLKLARFFTARQNLKLLAHAGTGAGRALTPIPGALAPAPRSGEDSGPAAPVGRDRK